MKLPLVVLALAAVAIAAPALSNAQASRPGPPTPITQASPERSNHDDDVCGLRTVTRDVCVRCEWVQHRQWDRATEGNH